MKTTKVRRPAAWLLVGAIAIFSLAAIACNSSSDPTPVATEEAPSIGAPAGVVDGTGPGSQSVQNSGGSSKSETVAGGQVVGGAIGSPAVEPVSAIAIAQPLIEPVPYGISTLYNGQAGTANSGIWVTGTANLEIPADVAKVSIGVESRETTVAEARQKAAEAMDKVLAGIKEHGVADDDIVTSYFNIQPQTVWIEVADSLGRHSEPRITGYIVTNTVQVTVREIDNIGPVVDTAATAGGNLIRINSIQFTVDDASEFGEQIRVAAAADALAKADLYARTMGVTLGPVVYLTEIGNSVPLTKSFPQAEMAAMDGRFARTQISAGDVNLSVSVQVVFAIAG